jgi:hypothetical protein
MTEIERLTERRKTVACLFVRKDSVYKTMPNCVCYDIDRDARTFPGGYPVVAHPPCPTWAGLRGLANFDPEVHALSPWAVDVVRTNGGCLEHPLGSMLWKECGIKLGALDNHGGILIAIQQWWFGHKAVKPTGVYVVGVQPERIPAIPFRLGLATHVIGPSRKRGPNRRPEVPRADREHTPRPLAEWLLATARLTGDTS